jgi:hypothetical protein
VLGDVDHERLRRLPRPLEERGDLPTGGLEVAQRHERRHAPCHGFGADLRVPELLAEIDGLGQHAEDLLE